MTSRVTMGDCFAAGFCTRGVRAWCRDNEVDLRRLVKEGIPFDELNPDEDALAAAAMAEATKREEADRG